MLCADPVTKEIRRFLAGPAECEVTGLTFTPDNKTLFINIQHPGEDGNSHWPEGGTAMPRSATLVITKNDGAERRLVALEGHRLVPSSLPPG